MVQCRLSAAHGRERHRGSIKGKSDRRGVLKPSAICSSPNLIQIAESATGCFPIVLILANQRLGVGPLLSPLHTVACHVINVVEILASVPWPYEVPGETVHGCLAAPAFTERGLTQ